MYIHTYIYMYMLPANKRQQILSIQQGMYTSVYGCIYMHRAMWSRARRYWDRYHREKYLRPPIMNSNFKASSSAQAALERAVTALSRIQTVPVQRMCEAEQQTCTMADVRHLCTEFAAPVQRICGANSRRCARCVGPLQWICGPIRARLRRAMRNFR